MEERPRHLEPITREALANFRVVVITGPRQAGKTTLVRRTLGGSGTFARLDQEATLQAALTDPTGFATFGATPRAFDEIQRGVTRSYGPSSVSSTTIGRAASSF